MSPAYIFDATLVLLLFVAASTDFLLGAAGRKKLSDRVGDLWLTLSDIELPTIATAEASYCLIAFDKCFGPKLFSWRRFYSCVVLNAIFVGIFYVLVEGYRFTHGMVFRPPFQEPHWYTNFPLDAFPGAISISFTRFILSQSLHFFRRSTYAVLFFLLAMVLSTVVSYVFYVYVGNVIILSSFVLFDYVVINIQVFLSSSVPLDTGDSGLSWKDFLNKLWEVFSNMEQENIAYLVDVAHYPSLTRLGKMLIAPYLVGYGVVKDFIPDWPIQPLNYSIFVNTMFSMVRIIFAIGFVVIWGVIRPLHRFVLLILLRFHETGTYSLTILAGLFDAGAKVIEVLFLHSP